MYVDLKGFNGRLLSHHLERFNVRKSGNSACKQIFFLTVLNGNDFIF